MKLSLRDAFWIITVLALAIGWAVERQRQMQAHSQTVEKLTGELQATKSRLAEAEDLLEFEGVVFGDGTTIHTTPERARQLREERQRKQPGTP